MGDRDIRMLSIRLPIWFVAGTPAPIDRALGEISISGKRIRNAPLNTAVITDFRQASETLHMPLHCSRVRRSTRSMEAAERLYCNTRNVVSDREIMKYKRPKFLTSERQNLGTIVESRHFVCYLQLP